MSERNVRPRVERGERQEPKIEKKLREISAENNALWLKCRALVNGIAHLKEKISVGIDELRHDHARISDTLLTNVDDELFANDYERPISVPGIGIKVMEAAAAEDSPAVDDPTLRLVEQLKAVEERWEVNAKVLIDINQELPIHEELLQRIASFKERLPKEREDSVGYQETVAILDELMQQIPAIMAEDRVARLGGEEQMSQEQLDLLNLQMRSEDLNRAVRVAVGQLRELLRTPRLSLPPEEDEVDEEDLSLEDPGGEETEEEDSKPVGARFVKLGRQHHHEMWLRQEEDLKEGIQTCIDQLLKFASQYDEKNEEAALYAHQFAVKYGPLTVLAANARLLTDMHKKISDAERRLEHMQEVRTALREKRRLRAALKEKIDELEAAGKKKAPPKKRRAGGAR
jgi:hypothetical protein